jgi:hypothetical protein
MCTTWTIDFYVYNLDVHFYVFHRYIIFVVKNTLTVSNKTGASWGALLPGSLLGICPVSDGILDDPQTPKGLPHWK